jgi:hypothetical protein
MSRRIEQAAPVRSRAKTVAVLAAGDAAVFAVFTAIGLRNHDVGFSLYHFGRDFVPLTVAWFLVAMVVDTYGRGGRLALALNWFVGVTAGIIVRKWWVGSPNGTEFLTFLAVALVSNGVILLAWRLLAGRLLAGRWRPITSPVPAGSVAGGAGEGEVVEA